MSEPLSGKPKVGRYRYRCLWSDCHHLALHTGQLKTHVRYYHTNERQYFCRHCDYRGVTKGDLLGHVRRRHGQDIVPQYLQSAGKRNQRVDGEPEVGDTGYDEEEGDIDDIDNENSDEEISDEHDDDDDRDDGEDSQDDREE